MRNYFTFDGVDSRSFGVYISGQGTFKAPARSYDVTEIPGRDGALLSMDSRLGNTDLTYPAFIYSNFRENVAAFRAFLLSHKGYFKLQDSYHPDEYRMAYFPGPFEPDVTSANNAGSFDITFVCKPQRYLESGETVVELSPSTARVDTYTGDPVEIQESVGDRITSLAVPIYPIQDLHGYARPWGPGGGKNIANYADCVTASTANTEVTILDSQNGFNVKTKTTGIYRGGQIANMTFEAGVTYTLSADIEITSGTAAIAFRKKSGAALISYSGAITENGHYSVSHTFTAADADDCRLSFFATYTTSQDGDVTFSNVMLEVGSTATSFAPYENVCPLSGSTSVSTYRTGKNLCKIGVINGRVSNGITFTENADGSVHAKGTSTAESFSAGGPTASTKDARCFYALPAGIYTISNVGALRLYCAFRNTDNTANLLDGRYLLSGSSYTFTATEPVIVYVRISVTNGGTVDNDAYVMVTEGSTAATVYEPWQMQTVTVDWTSAAGTVYGGTLDLVSGILTVGMVNIPSYNGETINEPWQSSMDAYAAGATPTIGAQVVYTLANPIEYQLTPQQIALLSNALNCIWSDSGPITVEVTEGLRLDNPTLFDALPLLRVYGTGVLGVGSHTITITAADEYTDIDCEMMDCFKGSENKNQYVQFSGNDFPTLEPGINGFTFSGISKVEVKPRWWSV